MSFNKKALLYDNTQMEITLSDVLSREIKNRGLSVRKLASDTRIPKTTLNDWMRGIKPSAKTLHHIYSLSSYLEIPIETLLFNVSKYDQSSEVIMSTTFKDNKIHYRITIEKL